ncbi:MAG TPA: YkgJ family cysteine cluster protein [Gammaproteobacteria bacterium]
MKRVRLPDADLERPATWVKFSSPLCDSCRASCCTMPAEVRITDLIRMGVVDPFEQEEPLKLIARRLIKSGIIDHFNHKSERFTLARRANGDCVYLDAATRRCTIYHQRSDTCRHHPHIGPRPGYCAYRTKG